MMNGCKALNPSASPIPSIDKTIVDEMLADLVDSGAVAGTSALIYSGGKEVYFGSYGQADREAGHPWKRDTLVTIYSMTKPITGVTLMSLYEDGLFELDDPLSKYLSEYENVKVLEGMNADGSPILVKPNRPIKVIDIFRHTACFGYGWEGTPAAKLMTEANVLDPSKPLSQFSEELAQLPLFCHPGEQWKYGVSMDVQARLAEVLTGRPYAELVQERVLTPLGMTDTAYVVRDEQRPRLSAGYLRGEDGTLSRRSDELVYGFRTEMPAQINGGHGLISTIDDYMRFALMLQNEGSLDGVKILKPETVALMTQDHLTADMTPRDFLPFKGQVGYGLNVGVRTAKPGDAQEPYGAVGEFFWDGAASSLFWVDPKNDVTVVFLTQIMPFDGQAHFKIRRAVYEGLDIMEESPLR
jgi:CubicO group peptidase (beta-lactamase class C family)